MIFHTAPPLWHIRLSTTALYPLVPIIARQNGLCRTELSEVLQL